MTRDSRTSLQPDELARIARLEVRAREVVEGFLSGMHRSPYFGNSVEFLQHREYVAGDEVRHIDWKASARHQRLITRNYEVEHYRNIVIVIDRGRLMAGHVGTGTKLDCAIDTALMIAGVALDGGDRCGVWVEKVGAPVIELSGTQTATHKPHGVAAPH